MSPEHEHPGPVEDCAECQRLREKAEDYLNDLRMLDTHSSDVDPGDFLE